LVIVACGLLLTACAAGRESAGTSMLSDAGPYDPMTAKGSIRGMVSLSGTPPIMEKIVMKGDAECLKGYDQAPASQEVLVGRDGGMQNVFVHVQSGLPRLKYPLPISAVEMRQRGCLFEPRVVGLMTGQPLRVVNDDKTLHNIRTISVHNRPFNLGNPAKGSSQTRAFSAAEVMIKARCDVHSWMNAYIGVVEHPFFAVSDPDGRFSIAGLPDGEYTLEAWHERYGRISQPVSIKEGQETTVRFEYKAE
jgi:hypothetical protein